MNKHKTAHLGYTHPLARLARKTCQSRHRVPAHSTIGGVACGACWEDAIRSDERIVIEENLPREFPISPDHIDEVAVERAVAGDKVSLTRAEQGEVVRRLMIDEVVPSKICRRMGISGSTWRKLQAEVAETAPDVVDAYQRRTAMGVAA